LAQEGSTMNGSLALGPWVLMSIIMVLAGGLGGTVNYFLTAGDDARGGSLRKSLALGIVASLMVPLFFRVVSSKILDDLAENSLRPQDVSFSSASVWLRPPRRQRSFRQYRLASSKNWKKW
jgi:hypothetical protein